MIRVCTINDKEILEKYLQEEPYAGAILAAIEEFGFDEKFQTVYPVSYTHLTLPTN